MYPLSAPTWQAEARGRAPLYGNALPAFGPVKSVHWQPTLVAAQVR